MRSIARLALVGIVVALVVSASYLVGFASGWSLQGAHALAPTTGQLRGVSTLCGGAEVPSEFPLFWEAWRIVEEGYYGQLPTGSEFTYAAIDGALDSLKDPYTYLAPPAAAQEESLYLTGLYEGIGTVVVEKEGSIVVVAPIEGSPAERAGIQPGDIIAAVDGRDITGLGLEEVVNLIRGPRGTSVRLAIIRAGQPQPLELTIMRERVTLPSVSSRLLGEKVGYVRIAFFSQNTGAELHSSVAKLKTAGAKALVLDLRSDPGGILEPATIEVASEFLPGGTILYEKRAGLPDKGYSARAGGLATDLPLVVLVDKGTASAAEIVAAALHESGRAILIGERTFGKGSIQTIHRLSDGSSLHVTVGTWLTPNRNEIHDVGLLPDIEVTITDMDKSAQKDPQLERALSYLAERI